MATDPVVQLRDDLTAERERIDAGLQASHDEWMGLCQRRKEIAEQLDEVRAYLEWREESPAALEPEEALEPLRAVDT